MSMGFYMGDGADYRQRMGLDPAPACTECDGKPADYECGHCDRPLCGDHSAYLSRDGRLELCESCSTQEQEDYWTAMVDND